MPQKPVGTRVIPTAEWFAGNAAMVGGLARAADSTGIQVSLYNDAPAGQYLWLWWVRAYNDGDGPSNFNAYEGAQGTFLQQGQYVMAGRGAAFGACYYNSLTEPGPDVPPSPSEFPALGYFGDDGGVLMSFDSPGPISVLPPGYTFAVENVWGGTAIGGATLACTFYYSILPYIPTS